MRNFAFPLKTLFLVVLSHFVQPAPAQTEIRKHFIVVIDKGSVNTKVLPELNRKLNDLFSNRLNSNISYKRIEATRIKNNPLMDSLFFSPKNDEISVYYPGISQGDITKLGPQLQNISKNQFFLNFARRFIQNLGPSWSDYKGTRANLTQLNNFITNISNNISNLNSNFLTLRTSSFLPAVLSIVASEKKAAEQYILITINSTLNQQNSQQFASVFSNLDNLGRTVSSRFKRIPVINQELHDNTGAYSCNLKAEAILPLNNDNTDVIGPLSIQDPVIFSQQRYNRPKFSLGETYIYFNHSPNLFPLGVKMKLYQSEDTLFSGYIAERNSNFENWSSAYSTSGFLMSYDDQEKRYYLPELKNLSLNNYYSADGNIVDLSLIVNSQYELVPDLNLKFIFRTNCKVNPGDIQYISGFKRMILISLIPFILLVLVIIYVVYYGRPVSIDYKINRYIDTFEQISIGKLMTDYKYWDVKEDNIIINCECNFRRKEYIFNWNPVVYVEIENLKGIPGQFEVYLRKGLHSYDEYHKDTVLTVKTDNTHKFDIIIGLRNTNIESNLIENPVLISVPVKLYIREKKLFINSGAKDQFFTYRFHAGPDLKDVWVGFDAGTSSTCMAIGTSEKISMGFEKDSHEFIIPSKLSIDLSEEPTQAQLTDLNLPDNIVRHGTSAEIRSNIETDEKFQSIKKLLGYKDIKKIVFRNNNSLDLNGSKLTSILIRRIFKDIKESIEKDSSENKRLLSDGRFDPKRLVVAIPNNFSQKKINDLLEAFSYIKKFDPQKGKVVNQFTEIRYVYEAEAIVLYYLKNYNSLKKTTLTLVDNKKAPSNLEQANIESLLVFDMGGATINTTLVNVTKTLKDDDYNYDVDIIGKIGYGIGGDTIDYCIIKFIFSFVNDYPELKNINPFVKTFASGNVNEVRSSKNLRIKYQSIALEIKKKIIQNFNKREAILITSADINQFFKEQLSIDIRIKPEDKINNFFKRNNSGNYPLFEHEIFQNIIYKSIIDATLETISLSNMQIDTLIFSGRSTFFPLIRQCVIDQLKKHLNNNVTLVELSMEEAKSAVARGACLYGLNKGGITLNNLKAVGTFGVAKLNSINQDDVEFLNFVKIGTMFRQNSEEFRYIEASKTYESDFRFSNGEVVFFQVMGKDAAQILKNRENHKINQIGKIRIDMKSKMIYMYVNENDEIRCRVKTITDRVFDLNEFVSDQEISDANDEHYTWIVQ